MYRKEKELEPISGRARIIETRGKQKCAMHPVRAKVKTEFYTSFSIAIFCTYMNIFDITDVDVMNYGANENNDTLSSSSSSSDEELYASSMQPPYDFNDDDEPYLCQSEILLPFDTVIDDFIYEDDDCDDVDAVVDEIVDKRTTYQSHIRSWAIKHNITHNALRDLAIATNQLVAYALPLHPTTLLQTPKKVEISQIGDGQYYWHNGLESTLLQLLANAFEPMMVSLNINMDGLPVYKSSRDELWPILFSIHELPNVKPAVIGVYHGKSKASNLDKYLTPMVNELKKLMDTGLSINGHKITIKLRCFICDSPARAFIKGDSYLLNTVVERVLHTAAENKCLLNIFIPNSQQLQISMVSMDV